MEVNVFFSVEPWGACWFLAGIITEQARQKGDSRVILQLLRLTADIALAVDRVPQVRKPIEASPAIIRARERQCAALRSGDLRRATAALQELWSLVVGHPENRLHQPTASQHPGEASTQVSDPGGCAK
ncbi:MAG: hypothetical protein AMXMBFR13_26520 [Phycisphaerae bacterium]